MEITLQEGYYSDPDRLAEIRRGHQVKKAVFLGILTFTVLYHRESITYVATQALEGATFVAMQALEGAANYYPEIRELAEYYNLLEPILPDSIEVVEQTWNNYLSFGLLS